MIPFTSIAMAATIAPKIEIYTLLACSVHKPEILQQTLNGSVELPIDTLLIYPIIPRGYSNYDFDTSQLFTLPLPAFQNDTHTPKPIICASDPVVQAAVAKLSTGECVTHLPFYDQPARSREQFIVLQISDRSIRVDLPWLSTHYSLYPKYRADGYFSSYFRLHGHPLLPDNRVVGCCESQLYLLLVAQTSESIKYQFSDRRGRTRVMGISIVGLLITDFNFIMVSRNFQRLPGGYWFLVVGPLIEGFLGG